MHESNGVLFDPGTHQYRVDGEVILSVTQVLRMCGLIDERWFNEQSAQRGQAIHLATQLSDEDNLDRKSLAPEIAGYLDAYQRFRQEVVFEPESIEHPYYSPAYRFAGTPDRTGTLNGETAVLDIKSGQKAAWHRLQTAGYALLLGGSVDRYIVYLSANGNYRLDQHRDSSDLTVFLAAVSIANWRTR